MKKYIYIIISLLFLYSCTDVLEEGNAGSCSINGVGKGDFVISMNIPTLDVATRSISGDPENGGGTWTNWEKFCDGALLYRVTIFVVDSEGTLVGYRDFYKGSADIKAEDSDFGGNGFYADGAVNTNLANGIAVKATFKANSPIHGNIEKLQAETYKIYAVANYAPISDTNAENVGITTTDRYAGLGVATADVDATSTTRNGESSGSDNNFTNIVNNIIDSFNNSTEGIANFKANTDFFNYKLNAGTDRVCKMQPQPLVMIRSVNLSETNQLNGELARTFARIRLTVQNVNTGKVQIAISKLAFNDAYASQKAFLFNDVGAGDLNLHNHFDLYENTENTDDAELNTKGLLDVSSDDAIIDFDGNDGFRMTAGSSRNFFDCYLLEGKIVGNKAYSFTASYWEGATGGGADENIEIHDWDDFLYDGENRHRQVFIRKDVNNSTNLLQANTTTNENGYVIGGNITISDAQSNAVDGAKEALDPIYIWEVQPTQATPYISGELGSTYGELFSIGTSMYLQPYDGTNTTPQLGYAKTGGKIFYRINFQGMDEKGSIYSVYNGTGTYWYISSDGKWTNSNVSATATNQTTPSISDVSYQRLTFETIAGQAGKEVPKTIEKTIEMSASSTTNDNRIVRNDFFWGTIPLYVNEQNLGVSLSGTELVWYIGEEATAQSVTVTKRDESLTWEYSTSSNFSITAADKLLTVTPASTATACEETVTITCSNGDEVTLKLKVIEKPAATTMTVNLTFKRGNNSDTFTDGVTVSSDVECSLSDNGVFILTYTDEDLSKSITFSYQGKKNTYTKTMTVNEFLTEYKDGGTITLSSN